MRTLKSGLVILAVIAFLTGAYFATAPKKQTISDKNLDGIKLSSSESKTNNVYDFDEKNNLTKNLGETLFEEIQNNNLINQEKRTLSSDVNAASENLANKVISDSLSDFKLVSNIYDSDLKISQDVSKEAKNRYLKAVEEINQKNFANFKENYLEVIVDTYQKINPSSANQLTNIYKALANDYLNITVPADWVDIHKRLIIYAKNAEIVYQAMANYPTDPIKGYLALETIDSLVSSAEEIQNIFNEKIKEISS